MSSPETEDTTPHHALVPTEMSVRKFGLVVHPRVFIASVMVILVFVGFTLVNHAGAESLFGDIRLFITRYFGWLLILMVQAFLLFALAVMISRFGQVRLGGADAKPEFGRLSWFAMLFAAGMGIGLVFWSVAEPVNHFVSPPVGEGGTAEAARMAMTLTFLHWGFHAWGIYAVVGLALAYFTYNRKLPLTIRSAFHPLIGDRIYDWPGDVIDTLAVVATLFGVATSLGFGVSQINSGLEFIYGVENTVTVKIMLIFMITLAATASVVLGLDRGIRRLSEVNLALAAALLLFVLALGPTLFLFRSLVQNLGHYMQHILEVASWTESYRQPTAWQADWTMFYWAWWISWSPFVGMFIARVSRGRTIREFILGVLLVPTIVTFGWITVFGGSAIHDALFGEGLVVPAAAEDFTRALFVLLGEFPLTAISSTIAMALIVVFFVTSSDSGSLVIDIITSGGNTEPPTVQRVFWATTEGLVAAILLLGGGLSALQTASIATGLPFAIVLALLCIGLLRALRADYPRIPPHVLERIRKRHS